MNYGRYSSSIKGEDFLNLLVYFLTYVAELTIDLGQ